MKRVLIVVDMQNDFIDGSLANEKAKAIVPSIKKCLNERWDHVIFTQDTHTEDYLNTPEGRKLPIKHCINGTDGWKVNLELSSSRRAPIFVRKPTFGMTESLIKDPEAGFGRFIDQDTEIFMCGTCTDICVISNALALKAVYPENELTVYGDLCAGLTEEKHNAALNVMSSCQINVINYMEG